jgi:ubiquinone/menaquinone biosynthesis C-methylase UbiE
MSPSCTTLNTALAPDWKEIETNHAQLEQRNALHFGFGYDCVAAVEFVLKKALPLRGRVLDVGTGKGRFVIPLARHVADVTTVDVNAEEQRHARLEAIYAHVAHRIRFVTQDARFLPWPAGSFDAVLSWNVFHHLDDPERVFAEMIRMVKRGGKLVLADFSPSGFRLMDAIHGAEGKRHPHPPNRFAYWQGFLRQSGFRTRNFSGHHEEVLLGIREIQNP